MVKEERSAPPGSVRELLSVSLPMVASNSCDTIMTTTDRYFLSQIGPEAMNACMAGGVFSFTAIAGIIGTIGYTTAMVGQRLGAGKVQTCLGATTQAFFFCCFSWPLVLCVIPLGNAFITLSGVPEEQLAYQIPYFTILCLGSVIPLFRLTLANFFTGLGKTRVVMISSMVTMIVNIGANWVLVFGKLGFEPLGIRGAAYGSLFAGLCGALVLLWALLKSEHKPFLKPQLKFQKEVFKELVTKGFPAGLELLLILVSFSLMVTIFHGHSLKTATATTVVLNWDMIAYVPLIGLEISLSSLVGRYVGARKLETVYLVVRSGLIVGVIHTFIVALAFAIFPGPLIELFRPDNTSVVFDEAMPMAVTMLRIASLYVAVEALIVVYTGALRGAGDTFAAMVISVSVHWALAIGLYALLNLLNWDPVSAWAFLTVAFMVMSLAFWLRFKSGRWKSKLHFES